MEITVLRPEFRSQIQGIVTPALWAAAGSDQATAASHRVGRGLRGGDAILPGSMKFLFQTRAGAPARVALSLPLARSTVCIGVIRPWSGALWRGRERWAAQRSCSASSRCRANSSGAAAGCRG
jgi:hypothetical protein